MVEDKEMMEAAEGTVLNIIKKRRSIRKYKDVGVEWDKVVQILEAGRFAPNAGNLQEWRFVVVTEKEIKRSIAEACLKQYWIETAPVIIVICAMTEKPEQFYGERGRKVYTLENCAMAAENMMLVATDLGLGSCVVGAFDEGMMINAVGILPRAKPILVLTVGYADEKVPIPPKTVLETLVFLQKYQNRIKNPNMVLWDWSLQMEKYVKEAKGAAESGASKLHEKIKHHAARLKEHIKKKMGKGEEES